MTKPINHKLPSKLNCYFFNNDKNDAAGQTYDKFSACGTCSSLLPFLGLRGVIVTEELGSEDQQNFLLVFARWDLEQQVDT